MRHKSAGFTIIEMMLVLAIGGLIILTTIMAIPALQRNSKNTARKQDVTAALQAISRWTLNHSGNLPQQDDIPALLKYTKLVFYEPDNSSFTINTLSPSSNTDKGPVTDSGKVEIYNYQKCDPERTGRANWEGAGYRDIVAIYGIETASGTGSQCQQL